MGFGICRFSVRGLVPLASALLAISCVLAAQDAPASEAEAQEALSPEVAARFAEFLAKMGEAKTKDESARLKKEIAEMTKVAGIDEAAKTRLEKPAEAAVELAVKYWQKKIAKLYRESWESMTVERLDQGIAQASSWVRNATTDYVAAADQPSWKEALAQVLSAEQLATWKAHRDEKERKFDEQSKGTIAATTERVRQQNAQAIERTTAAIALTLSLDEDRRKKLQQLGETAAASAADLMKEKVRRTLLNVDEARRKQILKTNSLYVPQEPKDAPEKQEIWKEGLKQILGPDEIVRWETAVEQRRARGAHALAKLLVWTMDEAAAFTTSQREQLAPLATTLAREHMKMHMEQRPEYWSSGLGLAVFYKAAAKAKDDELKAILDAQQVEHWKAAARQASASGRIRRTSSQDTATKPAAFEPEELETAISDYLHEVAEREQEREVSAALVQAEDAIRVAALAPVAAQRLKTAARGAMESRLESWRNDNAGSMRSQLENATPADLQQRIDNMASESIGRRRLRSDPQTKGIFETTVAAELTEAQRAAWQKEVDARKAYEEEASIASLLSELDRLCLLTADQWSQLEPLLIAQLKEYGPDLDRMFSSPDSTWFLQSYSMLTPIAGIPEKTMRSILTDGQWKQLNGSNSFNNAQRYWENIQTRHKQRLKEKKK